MVKILSYRRFSILQIVFLITLLLFSCKKMDNLENTTASKIENSLNSVQLPGWAKLINDTALPAEVKGSLDVQNYKFKEIGYSHGLWKIGLKRGSFGFENAKILIANTDQGLSWIYLSYDYDKSVYKKEDFKTYNGVTTIYNKLRTKTKSLVYKNGKIVKVIPPDKANKEASTNTGCPSCEPDPPDDPPPHDWCIEYPPLCEGGGGLRCIENDGQ